MSGYGTHASLYTTTPRNKNNQQLGSSGTVNTRTMDSRRGQSTVNDRTRHRVFSKTIATTTYRDNPDEHDRPVASRGDRRSADTDGIPDFNVTFMPLNDFAKRLPEVIEKLKADLASQNAVLLRKVEEQEETIRELEKQMKNRDIEQQRYQSTTGASFESENKSLKNKLDEVQVEYTKLEADYKDYISRAEECVKKAENDVNKLKSDQKSQEGTLQLLRQQVRNAEDAKQHALTRLSKQMGHQLTDGNPDITDLSDTNRPTKLGERFAEVYDNQWTEALEQLQGGGYSDRDCVKKLLEILKNCNKYACRAAENKLDELKKVLGISGMKLESDPTSQDKEVMSILKNLRKQMTAHFLPDLVKACLRRILTHMDKAVVAYAKECFELCWYMAVCDPPIHLEFNGTDTFDKNLFRHFTSTGNVLDYVVWPVVYLHKGGPVVSKGVAQPFPSSAINQGRQESRKPQREAWSETPSCSQDPYQHRDPTEPQYKYDDNQTSYNKHRETTGTLPDSSLYHGGNQDTGERMFNNGAAGQQSATLNLVPTNTTPTYQQFVTETFMHDQSSQQLDHRATHSSAYTKEGFSQQPYTPTPTTTPTPPQYRDKYGNIKKLAETDLNNYLYYSGKWEERHVRSYLGKETYEACRDFFRNIDTESNA